MAFWNKEKPAHISDGHSIQALLENDVLASHVAEAISRQNGILPMVMHPLFYYNSAPHLKQERAALKSHLGATQIAQYSKDQWFENISPIFSDTQVSSTQSDELNRVLDYTYELGSLFTRSDIGVAVIADEAKHLPDTVAILRKQGYAGTVLFYETDGWNPDPKFINWNILAQSVVQVQPNRVELLGMRGHWDHNFLTTDIHGNNVSGVTIEKNKPTFVSENIAGGHCIGSGVKEIAQHIGFVQAQTGKFVTSTVSISPIVTY